MVMVIRLSMLTYVHITVELHSYALSSRDRCLTGCSCVLGAAMHGSVRLLSMIALLSVRYVFIHLSSYGVLLCAMWLTL